MPDCGGEFLNYLPEQEPETLFSVSGGQRGIEKWRYEIKPKEIVWIRWYRC